MKLLQSSFYLVFTFLNNDIIRRIALFLIISILFIGENEAQSNQEDYQYKNTIDSLERIKSENLINKLISNYIASRDSLNELPEIIFGGAFRMNYSLKDYDDQNKDRYGDFGFEVFRINVDVDYNDIFLSAEQRWYADFIAIHHAYFGYHINDNTSFQIGVNQVPFGIAPYAAHSFWFNATYYLGFEDDYDSGIKILYDDGLWNIQGAYYKNSEYINSMRYGRYSFDLVTDDVQTNEEINQLNVRSIYKLRPNDDLVINLGLSAEYGQIYNQTTEKKGDRYAFAIHSNTFYKNWNLHVQWIDYKFNPKNPVGISPKTVQFGAFMFPFMVSSKANIYTINLAKELNINGKYVDKIKLYGNFSMVDPKQGYGSDSKQLVIGTTVNKRGLYAYFDYIMGQNMWFSGGPGIGLEHPDDTVWKSRLNINLGYYF